jgi:hypothetical protein
MRCKHCDARLAAHDIWCSNCGKQTGIINKDLASMSSLKMTWSKYLPNKGINVPAAAFSVLLGIVPIIGLLFLLNSIGVLDLIAIQHTGKLILNLFIISIGVSIFLPIILISYKPVCQEPGTVIRLKSLTSNLKSYPRYFLLSLISALFFVLIYLICFGLPDFGSDPILRLVWIVLVNYFLAVFLPVPVLMERKDLNPWAAFKMSYRFFHPVRWQLYLLALVLTLANSLAMLLALVPLVFTLPLSWFAIRDYVDLLLEYEIIRDYK